jgi:hypothetical protein
MRIRPLPRATFLALVPLVAASGTALGTTIHVPADQPTIQAALDVAMGADTVLVAPGIYGGPGNRDLDFAGKPVRLWSSGGAAVTIIDCGGSPQNPHRGILFDDNELGAYVIGFRFINGYSPGGGGTGDGGAILIDTGVLATSVVVYECEFYRNEAVQNGGGIAARGQGASLNLIKSTLAGNVAAAGGGLACLGAGFAHSTEVVYTGNQASAGGAVFVDECTLTGNLTTISGNHATNTGGGIFNQSNAVVQMNNIILWGNCADVVGGDMYCQISGASTFTCSDIDTSEVVTAGNASVTFGSDVIDQNPLFCGAVSCVEAPIEAGWYALAAASPCLAANNGCGQNMGRYDFGCSSLGTPGEDPVRDARPRLLAHPNPSRGPVRISLGAALSERPGSLSVYSVSGRLIRTLSVPAAATSLDWDGTDGNGHRVAAGLYLIRLRNDERSITGRVVLRP